MKGKAKQAELDHKQIHSNQTETNQDERTGGGDLSGGRVLLYDCQLYEGIYLPGKWRDRIHRLCGYSGYPACLEHESTRIFAEPMEEAMERLCQVFYDPYGASADRGCGFLLLMVQLCLHRRGDPSGLLGDGQ